MKLRARKLSNWSLNDHLMVYKWNNETVSLHFTGTLYKKGISY